MKRMIKTRQVAAWMVLHGLRQRHVAAEAGVAQGTVSRWLRGERNCVRLTRLFLAKGCPAEYLPGLPEEDKSDRSAA